MAGTVDHSWQPTQPSENQREASAGKRFTKGEFGIDFTNTQLTLRLKGELKALDTQLHLLVQGVHK
jgi:hypothetical protein